MSLPEISRETLAEVLELLELDAARVTAFTVVRKGPDLVEITTTEARRVFTRTEHDPF